MITADELKQATMKMVFFADGSDPKHMQLCQCVEHPRLMRVWASMKSGTRRMMYMVDYQPVAVREAPDRHEVLAQVLNEALAKDPNPDLAIDVEKVIDILKEMEK
jgi:hypothetical protein